jgi:N-methylhydantoinase A
MQGFTMLQERSQSLLDRDGVAPDTGRFEASADMRYVGQEFFVNVSGSFEWNPDDWATAFHQTYHRVHGHSRPEIPTEIVNLRVAARGPEVPLVDSASNGAVQHHERPPERTINVHGDPVSARVIQRADFSEAVGGPAIIEEAASTTFVPPQWEARPGASRTIVLTRNDR